MRFPLQHQSQNAVQQISSWMTANLLTLNSHEKFLVSIDRPPLIPVTTISYSLVYPLALAVFVSNAIMISLPHILDSVMSHKAQFSAVCPL